MFLQIKGLIQILAMILCLHPLHVTVTEIELDEKDKRLEIMMRIFPDDLEQTLRKKLNQPELDILAPKNATTDQLLENYLKDNFKIQLDGKPQKTSYLGHEKEDDAFILYIEVSNVKKMSTIQVTNSVMTEMFDDQSNIVNVTVRGNVKSLRLTPDTSTDKLTFDSK
jgi:hypothetical protein